MRDVHETVHGQEEKFKKTYSCQVYEKRDWDKVENAYEALAKFYGPGSLLGNYVLPHPLIIEI